jgi:hypothetical protein
MRLLLTCRSESFVGGAVTRDHHCLRELKGVYNIPVRFFADVHGFTFFRLRVGDSLRWCFLLRSTR